MLLLRQLGIKTSQYYNLTIRVDHNFHNYGNRLQTLNLIFIKLMGVCHNHNTGISNYGVIIILHQLLVLVSATQPQLLKPIRS